MDGWLAAACVRAHAARARARAWEWGRRNSPVPGPGRPKEVRDPIDAETLPQDRGSSTGAYARSAQRGREGQWLATGEGEGREGQQ